MCKNYGVYDIVTPVLNPQIGELAPLELCYRSLIAMWAIPQPYSTLHFVPLEMGLSAKQIQRKLTWDCKTNTSLHTRGTTVTLNIKNSL